MALARGRRPQRTIDYWPGFVDALSTLLLSIMFLLSVFVLAQFLLSREISGKDEVLNRLNSQINELTQLLSLERSNSQDSQDQLANLQASLEAAENERTRLEQLLSKGAGSDAAATARIGALSTDLDNERAVSQRAMSQVELLNQQIAALRKQIGALEDALDASETRDRESNTKIADLGRRLNVALAQRVQELNRYRSDFFGRLREILSDRENIRIVGDRFVFQSEVLFASGADEINEAGQGRDEEARRRHHRAAKGDPAGDQLGAARRRPHRQQAAVRHRPLSRQLGAVLGARHLGRQVPDRQRRAGQPAGRGGFRRVPAARRGRHRRSAREEPPHRAEAHRTVEPPRDRRHREFRGFRPQGGLPNLGRNRRIRRPIVAIGAMKTLSFLNWHCR